MREVLVWDIDFLNIPSQDLPESGAVIVCLDPQKRLGEVTWVVLDMDESLSKQAQGLFWSEEQAIRFADKIADKSLTEDEWLKSK